MAKENCVDDIFKRPFSNRSFEDKLKVVSGSKPRPTLDNLVSKHKVKKVNILSISRSPIMKRLND